MRRGAALLLILNLMVIGGLAVSFPDAMVSPGQLVAGHADIRDDCFACHTAFAGTPTRKCTSCHEPARIGHAEAPAAIAEQTPGVTAEDGALKVGAAAFHDALADPTCTRCHADHRGPHATTVQGGRFDHALLEPARRKDCAGCHRAPHSDTLHANTDAACRRCHETDRWTPATFEHTQLAADAPTDCTACHAAPDDPPHKAVTDTCASCHGLDGWTPAMFRHDRLANATQRDCAGCHAEEEPADALHRGTKGPYCGACHETDAWAPARFNHRREFALIGPHNADCETCHRSNDFQQYTCFACHAHDQRSVRFAHEGEVAATADCARCHVGAGRIDE